MNEKDIGGSQGLVSTAYRPLDTVRVGLVGAGFMAKLHSFAFATAVTRFAPELPALSLARVADLDPTLGTIAVDSFGWGGSTQDWREVTRGDDIDLVIVATPVAVHSEVAADAMAHGKHVLCEKPLARDAATASALVDIAAAKGLLHATAFAMRRWPAVTLAQRVLAGGEIGRLVKVRAHYLLDWALPAEVPLAWRFRREAAGSGAMGDVGSHMLDLMRCFAGEIDSVYARTETIRSRRPLADGSGSGQVTVEDAADLLLEFDSGASGLLEVGWMAPGHKTDIALELVGDAGAIRFAWARNHEVEVQCRGTPRSDAFQVRFPSDEDPDMHEFAPAPGSPLGLTELFVLQARNLLRALGSGHGLTPDFVDGLRVCEAIDAALLSSEQGCRVEVSHHRP